jgi:MinD-like ATPase involved in chromosome partitioning or flagellar assembly
MSRFGKRDVTDILELLENQLDALSRLEKVEKMKLRSQIRRQETFLLTLEDPKPAKVILRLQGRLAEVFRRYPSSFKEELGKLLEAKCSKLDKYNPE